MDCWCRLAGGCTPPYLFTGISNLLQPAQAEVVLGQRSTYLASWSRKDRSVIVYLSKHAGSTVVHNFSLQQQEALHTCITCVIYTCSIGFCPLYVHIYNRWTSLLYARVSYYIFSENLCSLKNVNSYINVLYLHNLYHWLYIYFE